MSFLFGLSPEQRELQAALRRVLEKEYDSEALRRVIASDSRFAVALWTQLAAVGTFGIALAEAHDGSGQGIMDVVAVMEVLGRMPVAAPVLETLVAGQLIARLGTDAHRSEWLSRIANGRCIATLAIDEPSRFWTRESVQAEGILDDGRLRLAGRKTRVPYAHIADLVLCVVRSREAGPLRCVLLERSQIEGRFEILDSMDDTYAQCTLDLEGLVVPATQAFPLDGGDIFEEAQSLVNLLGAAEMVGCMERALELLLGYARERQQFGKPIGSYQAMKHRCADLLTDLEAVRGSVWYAGWALHERQDDRAIAVSSAKAYASEAGVRFMEKALQSFGAIGFTWEHDIHFHLKRAKRLETCAGDAGFHRERIARILFGPSTVVA